MLDDLDFIVPGEEFTPDQMYLIQIKLSSRLSDYLPQTVQEAFNTHLWRLNVNVKSVYGSFTRYSYLILESEDHVLWTASEISAKMDVGNVYFSIDKLPKGSTRWIHYDIA